MIGTGCRIFTTSMTSFIVWRSGIVFVVASATVAIAPAHAGQGDRGRIVPSRG
jgi:hypothetical protein